MRLEFILGELNRLIESESDEKIVRAYRRVRAIILGLNNVEDETQCPSEKNP